MNFIISIEQLNTLVFEQKHKRMVEREQLERYRREHGSDSFKSAIATLDVEIRWFEIVCDAMRGAYETKSKQGD